MQNAIAKAAALIEAHQYIRQFHGKVVVVKVGGSIMDEPDTLRKLLADVSFMHAVGMRPIVVHGGGKAITQAMQQAGLEAHFVHGRRYTDERTLAIAEHVLINDINKGIVKDLADAGSHAMGLHSLSSCAVFARQLFLDVPDETTGEARKVDLGFVGEVANVNGDLLIALTDAGTIPVIAPIARDASGGKMNVNADSVAGHVAAAVKAEKFVLVSDTHGIRTTAPGTVTDATSDDQAEPGDDDFARSLTRDDIQGLIESGVITAGMLPKVESCMIALEAGVNKAHIIDGRIQHSLMLEVYTQSGVGTEIVL